MQTTTDSETTGGVNFDMTQIEQACRPTQAILQAWRDAYRAQGPRALIELTSGSNHGRVISIWCAAMTALYGPTGLHESRLTNGTPDPEKCADLDYEYRVARPMAEARERIETALAWADAKPATFANCWR